MVMRWLCDLKSPLVRDASKESWLVCQPVAGLTGEAGCGRIGSEDDTPHGQGNPRLFQGQVTAGRVNASEARVEASSGQTTDTRDDPVGLSHR